MDSLAWNRPCLPEHLSDISELIADWKAMAPFLGLSQTTEVADIVVQSPFSIQAQRVNMLRTWAAKLGATRATYKKLADIFRKRRRQDLVEKVAELVATLPDTSPGSDFMAAPSTSTTHPDAFDDDEDTDESINASKSDDEVSSPSTKKARTSSPESKNGEKPKFSMDDEHHEPLALSQGAHEEIKRVKDFAKNEVRIVIQSCNDAEYRAALEMLKPIQDFDAPVKYFDIELVIIVGVFAEQNTAIVRTAQGVECIEQLKRAFKIFQNARILLGLGICYGMKDNFFKIDLQFADVLVGREIGVSKTPKLQLEGLNPREKFKEVKQLMFNIFCSDSRWEGINVCEVPEQRTANVYVGRLCSASILMNDPARMEKMKDPWRGYLGGEMEGWAQFEVPAQSIIIKGISDFADGKKDDKWQLTAAKAAVSYAHYKLKKFGYIDHEQLETPSF